MAKAVSRVVIQVALSATFAVLGRWVQLHPERVFPKGNFVAVNSWGAKLARAQVAIFGTLAVFIGTAGTLWKLTGSCPLHSATAEVIILVIDVAEGLIAAIYVRKEVRASPPYQSTDPQGWWPS